ncbi:MAG: neutral/alkaline non-lysosomal ceramidase N-terminal domain-containing protein, partial [Clostridia bacterium]|nr:neutral/alkaline non-lysosomal ceramidase N-terminal domain-containing protein [Clostridia bacterium]
MRVAFYEKDITPPLGGYLAGYYTNYVADDVLDPLYVHAAVIDNGNTTVAVIAMDSCEFPDDMHDAVTKRITEYTGIPAKNVMITVNHTHKGMPIFDSPEINAYSDGPYKDVVYRLIADCVTLAYKRMEESDISFGCGCVDDISFNRTYIMKDGTIMTNQWHNDDRTGTLAGIDPDLPVLFFKNFDGKPMGAIISFACHQDCVLGGAAYTAGFSSVLSRELKKEYGDDFVTVLFAGASADINHLNPDMEEMPSDWHIHMGKRLANEAIKTITKAEPIIERTLFSNKEKIKVSTRDCDIDTVIKYAQEFAAEKNLMKMRNLLFYASCNKYQAKDTEIWLQCIGVGGVLLYGYPGEIFVNFGLDLKKRSKSSKNIVATLCNGGCGYVATKEALAENSRLYEKALCFDACLDEDAG